MWCHPADHEEKLALLHQAPEGDKSLERGLSSEQIRLGGQ